MARALQGARVQVSSLEFSPMPHFRKGGSTRKEHFDGKHRFEHWYRDNTIYFITARRSESDLPATRQPMGTSLRDDADEQSLPLNGVSAGLAPSWAR